MIFFPFIAPRSTGRDETARLAAYRADDDDFSVVNEPEYHVPGFAIANGLTDIRRAICHPPGVFKVNSVVTQIACVFSIVPLKRPYTREYRTHPKFACHGIYFSV